MAIHSYPRILNSKTPCFNPIELAKSTEKIVCLDNKRKYTAFYCTGVYGGISTGYLVGCCLRCIFCWVDLSRDYPEIYGEYYSPEEVANFLIKNAKKANVKKVRISGGEPTLSKQHLIMLLDIIQETGYFFILETNGIILGNDEEYVKALRKYRNLYLRISLKAGTAEGFERRTGADKAYFELPYKAIIYALKHNLFFRVASMSDERIMPREERLQMIKKLREIGYNDYLEEERCDPYDATILRLQKAGWKL